MSMSMTNTIVVSVEGVIGVGKSHMIDHLKCHFESDKVSGRPVVYLPEPVNVWMSVKGASGTSILEEFYQDQEKHAFSFQTLAMVSIAKQLRDAVDANPGALIITERSMQSCRSVFVRSLHASGMMGNTEKLVYDMVHDELVETMKQTSPIKQGLVYLKTPIERCISRVNSRNRQGEERITVEYMSKCGEYHDDFFNNEVCPKKMCYGEDVVCGRSVISAITDIVEKIDNDRMRC